jgi:hypothetical protein
MLRTKIIYLRRELETDLTQPRYPLTRPELVICLMNYLIRRNTWKREKRRSDKPSRWETARP